MKVLTAEAMRSVDERAIGELGVPSLVLMENAALGVVEAITDLFAGAERIFLFCGPGNNGGDGLAVARHLAVRGFDPRLVLATGGREPGGDAGVQLAICRRMGLPISELADAEQLPALLAEAAAADLLVDALFGTGLGRPLEGLFADLVEGLNRLPAPRLAVDLASGLNGSRAELLGPAIQADWTVTFAALKVAHVLSPAAERAGQLVVADLGIPPRLVEEAEGHLYLLEAGEVAAALAPRRADGHKGTYGHVLVVAGGAGGAGSAVLAARGALRCGAGLVTAAVPEPLYATVDLGSPESLSLALPASGRRLAPAAVEAVLEAAAQRDVMALGPGLGQADEVAAAIRRMVLESDRPAVVDADGVNAFAGRAEALAARSAATVLTPHPGEMGRLLGIGTGEVQADRRGAALAAARQSGAVVVLKGHRSLVATPAGELYVNPTGNPGMATGGSGDVLTGMIAALLAQGLEGRDAACCGVYLHGLAGDRAARRHGEVALVAGDLVDELPGAIGQLQGAGEDE